MASGDDLPNFSTLVDTSAEEQRQRPGFPLLGDWHGQSLLEIRQDIEARFVAAGIETGEARASARVLLEHVHQPHGLQAALADPALSSWHQLADLADLTVARLSRKPMAQVLGSQPFWTLDLQVTRDTLTPRADTEALVEAVLDCCGREPRRVLDLGTGTGAILLALLSERPDWRGVGIDLSEPALEVASRNALRCGLADRTEWLLGRWGRGLGDQEFDILVSNPPYIRTDVLAGLEPEVRQHEPALALDGGADGLDAYREIIIDCRRLLSKGGVFAVEIGYDQGESVSALARNAGLIEVTVRQDLAGQDRVVIGRSPDGNS